MINPEIWAAAIDKQGQLGRGPVRREGCALDVWLELPGTVGERLRCLYLYHDRFRTTVAKDNDNFIGSGEERAAYMSSRIRQLSEEVRGD